MTGPLTDLLSAASLLMTVVAILYSLWYPELTKIIEVKASQHKADNFLLCKQTKDILFGKAIPLALMSALVVAVFAPDAIIISMQSIVIYKSSLIYTYDAVRTAYCFVFIFSFILAVHILNLTYKVWSKWQKLTR